MKTVQINIGLNNNPLTAIQLETYLEETTGYRLMACYQTDKEYKGKIEPTFVAMLEHNFTNDSHVLHHWELVSSVLNQDCIAISTDSLNALAFSPSYKGERFRFCEGKFQRMILHVLDCE